MTERRIAVLLSALFLPLPALTQSPIKVSADRLLSSGGPELPLAESQLSANPNNPDQLLVGVMQFDSPNGNDRTCVAWASFDGGEKWVRHAFPVLGCSDPWGVVLADGSAIMVMLGYVQGREDDAFLFRSPDGRTWPDTPLGLGDHRDHPMVVAKGNEVYVASAQGVRNRENQHRSSVSVMLSRDGGRTFGPPTRVIASNLAYEAEGPVILSDGMFVVGFHDHHWQGREDKWLTTPRSWMLRSTDQGRTFSKPLLISESCDSRGGWPSMAADGDDRLFWLCVADKFNGVLVQHSEDRGESWSEPLRVNHSRTADSFTPSIAVNKDGVVGVSWYEIHQKRCLDVYFTASLDHGKTFLPEVRVSGATSCPDTPQDKGVFDAGTTFGAGGDYSGLAASSDGLFHVVWSDARSGIYRLRTATVTVKPLTR